MSATMNEGDWKVALEVFRVGLPRLGRKRKKTLCFWKRFTISRFTISRCRRYPYGHSDAHAAGSERKSI